MDIKGIAARTKICTLKTGAFRPVRMHKPETEAENARHHTTAVEAVRVRITSHQALASLAQVHSAAYQWHVQHTRPTVDDGVRLVPLARELEHAAAMGQFRAEHDKWVEAFLADYDAERAAAPQRLNGLYDAAMWLDQIAVRDKFRFDVSYRPCPTEGEWADWLGASVQAAQMELKQQLEDAVRRVAERCASDGRLYSSVFTGLKELLDLVPDLNLADDPRLKLIVAQATPLTGYDRESAKPQRQQIARDAQNILSMFGK